MNGDRTSKEIEEAENRGVRFGFKVGQMKMRERSASVAESHEGTCVTKECIPSAIRTIPIEGVLAFEDSALTESQ